VRHIVVTVNKSRTLRFSQPFSTAVVGATEFADVLPMTDTTLYVQGKKAGTTNVSVFGPTKQLVEVVDLEITPDVGSLRGRIEASTGSRGISVGVVNGKIVLGGVAADAVAAARAIDVAKALLPDGDVVNAMKVAPSQQVMLKVRILEVDRDIDRDLGVNWSGGGKTRFATGTGTVGVPASGTFPGASASDAPFGTVLANIVNTHGIDIDVLLTALEGRSLVKSLAEPNLVTLTGTQASFLVGGQIPVPTVQPGASGGAPTVSVQYQPFGVQLKFTPTVLEDGLVDMRLDPAVTAVAPTGAVLVNGTTIPQLTDREAHATVELRDGQSFALAGLLQADDNQAFSQLPYIGSIPILGALFRSESYQKAETELVIIVTPHLVRPSPPNEHLATPFDETLQANDVDFFLMGATERKKKYNDYVTSGGDLKGPYGYLLDSN